MRRAAQHTAVRTELGPGTTGFDMGHLTEPLLGHSIVRVAVRACDLFRRGRSAPQAIAPRRQDPRERTQGDLLLRQPGLAHLIEGDGARVEGAEEEVEQAL